MMKNLVKLIFKDLDPWTETGHFYSFYENPEVVEIMPKEGKTSVTTEVLLFASEDKPFSTRKS